MYFKTDTEAFNDFEWASSGLYSVRITVGWRANGRPFIGRFRAKDHRGVVLADVAGQDWWFSPESFIAARRLSPLEELAFATAEEDGAEL